MDIYDKKTLDEYDSDSSDDSSIDVDDNDANNFSMAASAAYIPGVSLADKLRLAASKGHIDQIRELLQSGATFEPDREGRTALHYASLSGNAEAVQGLIQSGCDIDAQDRLGYTSLHRAAAQGHVEVVRVLVLEGCLIDRQDEVHGNGALHEAAWNGYSKTMDILLRNKANIHIVNKAGFTALHLAAQNGHNQSARILLYANCNSNLKNNYGDTALHTAARYGHAGVTRILISAHCDINMQNKNGDTGLHIACALKRRKIAKLLTEGGIKTNIKNKQNETAADVAKRKDYNEILFIITSQPKLSKKEKSKKKSEAKEKEKASKTSSKPEEKKEKKGFFQKWKSKSKDKEKDKENQEKEVRSTLVSTDNATRGTSSFPPPSVPSEVSSSDFHSQMAPEDHIKAFREHAMRKKDPALPEPLEVQRSHSRGTTTFGDVGSRSRKDRRSVRGLVTHYDYKQGTQYYKDLAGNVREGPIGFTPNCKCGPAVKKLEKRITNDRNTMYDHIDASHRTLSQRLDQIDTRTNQQVFSLDRLMQERLDAEKRERDEMLQKRCIQDRQQLNQYSQEHHRQLKSEMNVWMNSQFNVLERRYDNHARACDGCYSEQCTGQQQTQPHYHRDDLLNEHFCHVRDDTPPAPGRIYRSKSDESLASSHHSRRHWKIKSSADREIEAMREQNAEERKRERHKRYKARKEGESGGNQRQRRDDTPDDPRRPSSYHDDMYHEGQGYRYRETSSSPQRGPYTSLPRGQSSEACQDRGRGMVPNSSQVQVFAQVHAHPNQNQPQNPSNGNTGSKSMEGLNTLPDMPPPRSTSHMATLNSHLATEISVKPPQPSHDSSTSTFNSPDSAGTHHSKTDSAGSNPDSGYGSRIYNQNLKPTFSDSRVAGFSEAVPNSTSASQPPPSSAPVYFTDTRRSQEGQTQQSRSTNAAYASTVINKWYEQKVRERSVERTLGDGQRTSPETNNGAPKYLTGPAGQSGGYLTRPAARMMQGGARGPQYSTQGYPKAYASQRDSNPEVGRATQV